MHDINLLDETFVKNQSYHYHLSIQTGLNGLSFSILDLQNLKYIGLRNYTFENINNEQEIASYFSAFYQNDDLLNLNYKSVSHVFVGDNATVLPAQYFDETTIQDYYRLNFQEVENKIIQYNGINSGSIFSIFGYPEPLFNKIKACFPQSKMLHYSSVFIENVLKESVNTAKMKCHVYFYSDFITIALAEQKQLKYYNTFKTLGTTDILYYLVSVFDQFEISTKQTELFISSDIAGHDEIFENLNMYFGNIKFIAPSDQFTYSYLFDELHLTQYANLFNLVLCE